jgi:hypothetical protein
MKVLEHAMQLIVRITPRGCHVLVHNKRQPLLATVAGVVFVGGGCDNSLHAARYNKCSVCEPRLVVLK